MSQVFHAPRDALFGVFSLSALLFKHNSDHSQEEKRCMGDKCHPRVPPSRLVVEEKDLAINVTRGFFPRKKARAGSHASGRWGADLELGTQHTGQLPPRSVARDLPLHVNHVVSQLHQPRSGGNDVGVLATNSISLTIHPLIMACPPPLRWVPQLFQGDLLSLSSGFLLTWSSFPK